MTYHHSVTIYLGVMQKIFVPILFGCVELKQALRYGQNFYTKHDGG